MGWIKCSKEAFEKCSYKGKCGRFDDAFFMDESVCDEFNQSIKSCIVDAVPVSELLNLRDELYEKDQITMRGLEKLNRLIAAYSSQLKQKEHPIESTPLKQEERWLKTV